MCPFARKDFAQGRRRMVAGQLAARGIRDRRLLEAMGEVPREEFVPPELVEFAYEDSPLPIDESQTISQPFIVARMIEALDLQPGDRVLEVGAGSGYAAAVLGRMAAEVFTIERHRSLADSARERCRRLGYENVHVRHGDGSLGWPEEAPFDAIVVAAGGPEVPDPLREQLAPGGRLVIPVGPTPRLQQLLRVRRGDDGEEELDSLEAVRFVPLVGASGWEGSDHPAATAPSSEPGEEIPPPAAPEAFVPAPEDSAAEGAPLDPGSSLAEVVAASSEPFPSIQDADLDALMERIGDARVVCMGEATHGTAEFYDMRARLTHELVRQKGFNIVAVEADWPDAQRVDAYVRKTRVEAHPEEAFDRFPTWMWANEQVLRFAETLKEHNASVQDPDRQVGFHGLDLYSLHRSIQAVLRYLDDVDPEAARVARHRYGCLSPWEGDPAAYGAAAVSGRYKECEGEVVRILRDLLDKRLEYGEKDGERFFDAAQNARLVQNAEEYYRTMYRGARSSWNLRDQHMFDTLQNLLRLRGDGARAVVWAHNSHLGDARATEMGAVRGEHNVGQLCREEFGEDAFLIGFGTDHGTVAAATHWDGPMEVKQVRPSHEDSYERLCHEAGDPSFFLPLRHPLRPGLRERLTDERLERAIGVIYRPETELQSHYFRASLPRQFDEYVWFDETRAVDPLDIKSLGRREGLPETFPFGV
ncbi:MAG: protein-L-isoaspartate(D-aspartate) O-methyltransferase [Longimicrobiales bacterium]